jgi:hypothetical protein
MLHALLDQTQEGAGHRSEMYGRVQERNTGRDARERLANLIHCASATSSWGNPTSGGPHRKTSPFLAILPAQVLLSEGLYTHAASENSLEGKTIQRTTQERKEVRTLIHDV